ncbi:MAG: DMT family transporter [Gaiellales bacterium]
MIAFLLAGLAGVCFGALAVAVRTGLTRAPEPYVGPFVASAVACVLVVVAAAVSGDLGDASPGSLWPYAVIGLAVPGLSQILFVRAIRDAGPARAAVLIGTAPLISAVLAIAFLDETFGPALAIGTVLIVAGGALLAFEGARPAHFKAIGAVLAIVCAVLFALRDNLVRAVSRGDEIPALAGASASLAGSTLALLLFLVVVRRGRDLDRRLGHTTMAFLPAGIFLGAAYCVLLEAFARGNVTIVAPLNATQSLWAVLFSALLLRRTESIGSRLVVASVLIVAGSAVIGATR